MTTWYIAGPMTGRPDWNYPAFMEAETWLREREPEARIINPAAEFDGDTTLPRETYLRRALANVASCDRMLLLPGWRESRGACLEVVAGYHCGVEFEAEWGFLLEREYTYAVALASLNVARRREWKVLEFPRGAVAIQGEDLEIPEEGA